MIGRVNHVVVLIGYQISTHGVDVPMIGPVGQQCLSLRFPADLSLGHRAGKTQLILRVMLEINATPESEPHPNQANEPTSKPGRAAAQTRSWDARALWAAPRRRGRERQKERERERERKKNKKRTDQETVKRLCGEQLEGGADEQEADEDGEGWRL